MSLDRPRRIFRSSGSALPRVPAPRTLFALAMAALGTIGTLLYASSSETVAQIRATGGQLAVPAPEVAVIDGSTLRLADVVVHLAGVAAPARGQQCRRADGTGFDCAAAATAMLAGLVREHAVACHLDGQDAGGVPKGFCEAAGTDLNRAVVLAGWAHAGPDVPALRGAEQDARARHRGLWQQGASF